MTAHIVWNPFVRRKAKKPPPRLCRQRRQCRNTNWDVWLNRHPRGERTAVAARSGPLALERRTLRESESAHGAKILHLAFAGKGGGKTGGV